MVKWFPFVRCISARDRQSLFQPPRYASTNLFARRMARHGFRQHIGGEEIGELQAWLRIIRSRFIVFFVAFSRWKCCTGNLDDWSFRLCLPKTSSGPLRLPQGPCNMLHSLFASC